MHVSASLWLWRSVSGTAARSHLSRASGAKPGVKSSFAACRQLRSLLCFASGLRTVALSEPRWAGLALKLD